MKSNFVRWVPLLAGAGVLAATGSARAAVVWTSTFEKGDLSEWSPGINDTKGVDGGLRKNVVVEGATVYTGKYACEITVHPDDTFTFMQNRVDIQHQSTLTAEGKDMWISGHYMMPADAGVRNEFAFWESNVSYSNVMDFWVEPKTGGGTTINFGVGFLGATKVWTGDFAIGKWHQVALHVHWSTSPTLGSVDVWFDGQQVVKAYSAKTKADANTLFYQNGLHRIKPANVVDTMYIDDFVEADSFAEAQIAAPGQPDGGTSGNAGGDGGADAGGAVDAGLPGSGTDAAGGGASGATSGAVSTSGSGAGATTGVGATAGAGAATGNPGASGSSGNGVASGGASGGATGVSASGAASPGTSGSSGCSVPTSRAPTGLLFGAAFALIGLAFARRRAARRGSASAQSR